MAFFSALMHYGGNFLEVSGLSFFGGNLNVNSKLGGSCGASLAICIVYLVRFWRPNKRPTSFRRLPLYIPFERLVCTAISIREIEAKPTGKTAVTCFIMNGIE